MRRGYEFELRLSEATPRFVRDYRLRGGHVLPPGVALEMVLAAVAGEGCSPKQLEIAFARPIPLEREGCVQLVIEPRSASTCFRVIAQRETGPVICAQGQVLEVAREPDLAAPAITHPRGASLVELSHEALSPSAIYRELDKLGLELGVDLRPLRAVWLSDGQAAARLDPRLAASSPYVVHPLVVESAFQLVALMQRHSGPSRSSEDPAGWLTPYDGCRLRLEVNDLAVRPEWLEARCEAGRTVVALTAGAERFGELSFEGLVLGEIDAGSTRGHGMRDRLEACLRRVQGRAAGALGAGAPLDSLRVLVLQHEIERELGVRLPLWTLAESTDLPALESAVVAAKSERRQDTAASPSTASLASGAAQVRSAEPPGAPFPLTPMQQALWLGRLGGFAIGNVGSHGYFEFDLEHLEVDRLERVVQTLVQRHDMLRCVVQDDGMQRVLAQVPAYRIATHALTQVTAESRERRLLEVRARLSHRRRPEDQWPPFAIEVSRLPEAWRVHVSIDTLVADLFSIRLLVDEAVASYRGQTLPAMTMSFRQIVTERGPARPQARAYWQRRLAELHPPPALPYRKDLRKIAVPHFERLQRVVDSEHRQRLEDCARARSLTLSAMLCAVYAEVLAQWSASSRFSIVLTSFNRPPLPGIEYVVGDFVSSVLLSLDMTAEPFSQRVQQLQRRLWRDLEHADYSGVEVLRDLARADGQASIFPVVFTSAIPHEGMRQSAPWEQAALRQLRHVSTQTPQVVLDHQLLSVGDALVLSWDYVPEAFDAGVVEDMFDAYQRALERVVEDRGSWDQPRMSLVSPQQRAVWEKSNATRKPLPGLCVHQLFERQVERHAERPAVISVDRTLSHAELDREASALAVQLRAHGVVAGAVVPVLLDKGWQQVVAVLGILKAGAAYLPLDVAGQHADWQRMLDSSAAPLLLVGKAQAAAAAALPHAPPTHALEDLLAQSGSVAVAPVESEPVRLDPRHVAYVLPTSGTTGSPAGVEIRHLSVVNAILDTVERFEVGPDDRTLAITALHHDMSVFDLFGPLCVGGAVVVPSARSWRDPAHWIELIARHEVTLWNSVPAFLHMLFTYLETCHEDGAAGSATDVLGDRSPPPTLGSLRCAFVGGDWIALDTLSRMQRWTPGARLISVGGPTETTLWNICHEVTHVDAAWRSIPYGRPMANTQYFVLNERAQVCPLLVAGELCVAGTGLAKGYLGDPSRTAERFFVHPDWGLRLYRTGDVGRYQRDGSIELLGRRDLQVKIGGHRVELRAIEAVLCQHPAVLDAAVVAPVTRGSRRLVAHVVLAGVSRRVPAELTSHLRAQLPAHCVPAAIITWEQLPLGRTGKVDRTALEAHSSEEHLDASQQARQPAGSMGHLRLVTDDADREPRAQVLALIAEASGRPVASLMPELSLSELGLSSLDIVQLAVRIRTSLQRPFDLEKIFAQRTLSGLLDEATGADASRDAPEPVGPPPLASQVGASVLAFLGGAGCDAVHYTSLFAAFRAQGLRVRMVPLSTTDPAPLGDFDAVVAAAQLEVEALGERPMLVGHSLGGLVAYEVAMNLQGEGRPPAALVLLCCPAPSVAAHMPITIADLFAQLGGQRAQVPEDLEGLLPRLSADVALWNSYRHRERPPLRCPLLVVRARRDTAVAGAAMASWIELTQEAFLLHHVGGDHFVRGSEQEVAALVARLRDALALRPGSSSHVSWPARQA